MSNPVDQLKALSREYQLLSESAAVLGWDQETYIPPRGVPERGEQLALLQSLAHKRITADRVGELLASAGCSDESPSGNSPTDSTDAAYLRELYRLHTRAVRIPSSLIEESARVTSAAQAAWVQARNADDFALFKPHLEGVLNITIEKAQALGYTDHPYDALIDEFEPWMTTAEVSRVFSKLEGTLTGLAHKIAERPPVDDSLLHQQFAVDKQRGFARRIVSDLGYDFERGRIDETAHPFTTSLGGDDVRITGRFREDFLGTGLFGLIHECGHALYEQGIDQNLKGTILGAGTSLGIHESQSRTWENIIGRSKAFWEHYLPLAREYFPDQLGAVGIEDFYRGINRVAPTHVRIDADEVTYGLHIILRFNLELALVSRDLSVADLPAAWREMSHKMLGIKPEKSSEAELQDIHWSMGAFGYFPTYALGNLYAAQFWKTLEKDIGPTDRLIGSGNFSVLHDRLRSTIYRFGSAKSAGEICMDVTGESLNADYFSEYLYRKYNTIYAL